MGTNINFKNFGNEPPANNGGSGSRPPGNFTLSRQPSVYSLTFDEFQSAVGGLGKDYGSMNMDELLKSIWTAEEIQSMASGSGTSGQDGAGASLQRQGSLTLPRTLSQKTVDEVWKDISKEYAVEKDGSNTGGASMPQRQQTLGEITLEEFLMRAGVVREDMQLTGKTNTGAFLGDLSGSGNNTGLGIGFREMGRGAGLMGNSNQIPQSSNLPLNVNGALSNQQQQQVLQPQLFPKQPAMGYASQMPLTSGSQLGNTGMRAGVMGVTDQGINNSLVQNSAFQGGNVGVVGLGAAHAGVATGSPAKPISSSDGIGKSAGDTSSVSPVPYMFNGGLRARRSSAAVDKVIERRQRRMIKNRESAARSRARKQAYTMELEAENAKLKEENEELRRKQAELMEIQKNQALEMRNLQRGVKKQCLRRTLTGPW